MKSHEIIITTESEEFCRFYDSIFGSETPIWKLEKSFLIKSTRKKIKLNFIIGRYSDCPIMRTQILLWSDFTERPCLKFGSTAPMGIFYFFWCRFYSTHTKALCSTYTMLRRLLLEPRFSSFTYKNQNCLVRVGLLGQRTQALKNCKIVNRSGPASQLSLDQCEARRVSVVPFLYILIVQHSSSM